MKKITFIDIYSGRNISFRLAISDSDLEYYRIFGDRNVIFDKMSDYQRRRLELFFGKRAAYYTKIEAL